MSLENTHLARANHIMLETACMSDIQLEAYISSLEGLAQQCVYECLKLPSPHYCRIFYFLSKKYHTLDYRYFEETYLSRGFEVFSETELYYLYEGIQLQLERGFTDFYFVYGSLFKEPLGHSAQHFLICLAKDNNFRFRECLFSDNKLTKTKGDRSAWFKSKLAVYIMENGCTILNEEMKQKGVLTLQKLDGCMKSVKKINLLL